jgi:hypothetical protein
MAVAATQRATEQLDSVEGAMRPEEYGGVVLLHHLTSMLVAHYGAEIVATTAHDLEEEQDKIIDDYVTSLLEGLPDGMNTDDD